MGPVTGGEVDMALDLHALTAGSADMSSVATPEGIFLYVSPASRRLFGWDPIQLEGRREDEFIHSDDLPSFRSARESGVDHDRTVVTTHRFQCADGSYRWTESTARRVETGGSTFVVTTVRDISERQRSDAILQHRAMTDPLTGVANRTVLMDRLHQALRRQARGAGILAVLFLDLDRFKLINDSLGHRVGDGVLQAMAERLLEFIRPSDTLARMGGDEFVLVAEDMPDEGAVVELGNRIIEAGREPYGMGEEEFVCTVSVGIATTADAHHGPERLLQEADLALYRAKDRGRDRAEVFDEELRTTAVGRLGTERMLRRAIADHRIRVQYQPIFDLQSGQPVRAEALVRIVDPTSGLLEPASFLEVAEETGLLTPIDGWVLGEAVQQAAAWRARFGANGFAGVGVNITSRHLADAGLATDVIEVVDANGLPRDHLQVEVTERVLMEASNSAMSGLRALRTSGVLVGLDDFGTGYSSLAYLRQFPLDFVKIDGLFVRGLMASPGEDAIVAAIIGLSHALGLIVVAEGVEAPEQLESLRSLDCDLAQGFLLGRPGSPEAMDALLAEGDKLRREPAT
jgi:diguanylate cyclase (GGDEF)-like protein/PAS domain S-box-containing protein